MNEMTPILKFGKPKKLMGLKVHLDSSNLINSLEWQSAVAFLMSTWWSNWKKDLRLLGTTISYSEGNLTVTVCGVGGRTLSVGLHRFRFGWMNLDVKRKAPNWWASSLAWHSCQVKSCEWVCGESLCEVKIACFCNKSWVILPLHTLLDSPVVEWEIAWLVVCIWREI